MRYDWSPDRVKHSRLVRAGTVLIASMAVAFMSYLPDPYGPLESFKIGWWILGAGILTAAIAKPSGRRDVQLKQLTTAVLVGSGALWIALLSFPRSPVRDMCYGLGNVLFPVAAFGLGIIRAFIEGSILLTIGAVATLVGLGICNLLLVYMIASAA